MGGSSVIIMLNSLLLRCSERKMMKGSAKIPRGKLLLDWGDSSMASLTIATRSRGDTME